MLLVLAVLQIRGRKRHHNTHSLRPSMSACFSEISSRRADSCFWCCSLCAIICFSSVSFISISACNLVDVSFSFSVTAVAMVSNRGKKNSWVLSWCWCPKGATVCNAYFQRQNKNVLPKGCCLSTVRKLKNCTNNFNLYNFVWVNITENRGCVT